MKTPFRLGLIVLCALTAVTAGCSRQKPPPPPKTQPELLLGIYDAARRQQYEATLLKIQKMRALNPSSIFLAELENTVRFNRLTAVVNTYLQMGKFESALNALQDYEKQHGYSEITTRTKERLFFMARLDRGLGKLKTARRSEELESEIEDLKKLTKNIELTPKIVNFIRNKESVIPELRKLERELMLRELQQEIRDRLEAGDRKMAAVLTAVYAMEVPGGENRFLSALSGPDNIRTNEK
ncbi:MAG: hypothetical protein J5806_07510 [Lentisphaeria bacterium]|nr:hypothetical protein [Lentisphaeria bacterium]